MKRALVFAGFAVAALVGFGLLAVWYLGSYQSQGGSFGGMMGQMFGTGPGALSPMPGWVWMTTVALLAVVSFGIVGVAYYSAYPEIRAQTGREAPVQAGAGEEAGMTWSVLLKTSKPEERKVLEVLASHDGRYLQKFIVKESGLSKLKTHRILSRFSERGIVVAEKSGNTNEVALASWLRPEPSAP